MQTAGIRGLLMQSKQNRLKIKLSVKKLGFFCDLCHGKTKMEYKAAAGRSIMKFDVLPSDCGYSPGFYSGMAKHAQNEVKIMWYVIQTTTGKEMELADVIEKMLGEKYKTSGQKSYEKCFVIRQEFVWRIGGSYRPHLKPLFPSYVFVETNTPEQFFYDLKQIPKLTKLLSDGEMFLNIREEEEKLLSRLLDHDPEYIIRRLPVRLNEEGDIIAAGGVLKDNLGSIVKKRLRKRVVVIEIPFLGEMRRVEMGVKVEKD